MTLNEAAVGERTVFAPGMATKNDAAVMDVTLRIAFVRPETVTLKDAAVDDRTVLAPGIVTLKDAAVFDNART